MKNYRFFFIFLLIITVGCTQIDKQESNSEEDQTGINQPVETYHKDYYDIGKLVTLSEESYLFEMSYQLQKPFKEEPQITYKPFFAETYENKSKPGVLLSDNTIHFESLYSASEKDPFVAWDMGSENYHYLDFAVVTNNELKKNDELFFIFASGAHSWVTKTVNDQGDEIRHFYTDADIDVYKFKTGIWYTIYKENINQDSGYFKVQLSWGKGAK